MKQVCYTISMHFRIYISIWWNQQTFLEETMNQGNNSYSKKENKMKWLKAMHVYVIYAQKAWFFLMKHVTLRSAVQK